MSSTTHKNARFLPASVFVIDLVKHSVRPKEQITKIQDILRGVFADAASTFTSEELRFNYTGDGYFCAFLGNSSGSALDFISRAVPELSRKLKPFEQTFRAGVDIGLIKLTNDPLTKGEEFFDQVGINASRLQAMAEPGEILCTEIFHAIYAPSFPGSFSTEWKKVSGKDRSLNAYQVFPINYEELRQLFSELLHKAATDVEIPSKQKPEILVVDDERVLGEFFTAVLGPGYEVTWIDRAERALEIFRPDKFPVVITDVRMMGMDGIELTEQLLEIDPHACVIAMSAYRPIETNKRFLALGGLLFLSKPFNPRELQDVIWASVQYLPLFKKHVGRLGDNIFQLFRALLTLRHHLRELDALAEKSPHHVVHLLRHKAKQLIALFLWDIGPRRDVLGAIEIANTQFGRLLHLSKVVSRIDTEQLEAFLRQYVQEQGKIHPEIQFSFVGGVSQTEPKLLPLGAALTLSICELLDNAVSAIAGTGTVLVEITYLKASGLMHVIVHDNGPGIPSEIMPDLFREGVSTKGNGRGLGLSLIQSVILSLKGEMKYEFRNGARFTLLIPV